MREEKKQRQRRRSSSHDLVAVEHRRKALEAVRNGELARLAEAFDAVSPDPHEDRAETEDVAFQELRSFLEAVVHNLDAVQRCVWIPNGDRHARPLDWGALCGATLADLRLSEKARALVLRYLNILLTDLGQEETFHRIRSGAAAAREAVLAPTDLAVLKRRGVMGSFLAKICEDTMTLLKDGDVDTAEAYFEDALEVGERLMSSTALKKVDRHLLRVLPHLAQKELLSFLEDHADKTLSQAQEESAAPDPPLQAMRHLVWQEFGSRSWLPWSVWEKKTEARLAWENDPHQPSGGSPGTGSGGLSGAGPEHAPGAETASLNRSGHKEGFFTGEAKRIRQRLREELGRWEVRRTPAEHPPSATAGTSPARKQGVGPGRPADWTREMELGVETETDLDGEEQLTMEAAAPCPPRRRSEDTIFGLPLEDRFRNPSPARGSGVKGEPTQIFPFNLELEPPSRVKLTAPSDRLHQAQDGAQNPPPAPHHGDKRCGAPKEPQETKASQGSSLPWPLRWLKPRSKK